MGPEDRALESALLKTYTLLVESKVLREDVLESMESNLTLKTDTSG